MFFGFFFWCTQPFTSFKNCATVTAKVQCKNILADQQTAAVVLLENLQYCSDDHSDNLRPAQLAEIQEI